MTNANHRGTVSVIGIGNMGSALAEALLVAGFSVTVWNRAASKAERMVEQGAVLADTPAAAALASENTIVCVTDHEAFVSIIHNEAVATALDRKRLIQLGIVTAEQARQTASWASARNIGYLEGSILGIPDFVKNATATLVCSGPKVLFEAVQPQLSVFGNSHLVSESVGSAYEFDKVFFSCAYATWLGFIQGAAMAHASGFSFSSYTEIVSDRLPKLAAGFTGYGELMASRNHDGDQGSLAIWADAYSKSLDLCRTLNVDDTLPTALMQNFDKAISAGYGDKELSAIFEVLLPQD